MIYSKEIEVKYNTDICVVGAGPAGIAAALTAARDGKKVFIVESQGCFGGAATSAFVPAFMPFHNGGEFLAGGIGKEIHDTCADDPDVLKRLKQVGINFEKLKRTYDRLITNEPNIEFLFFTNLIDVIVKNGIVECIIVSAKSGIYAISAKMFVDGTGDGDLCVMAGADYEKGDENGDVMPSTLCSIWYNIEWEDRHFGHNVKIDEALADGVFTQQDRHVPGIWRSNKDTGGGNIGHEYGVDSTDEMQLTKAMVSGRKRILEYKKYYNDYVKKGFDYASPLLTAPTLGIRESRRIVGEYVLNIDDYVNRANFSDEIGRFAYNVDIHASNDSKEAFAEFAEDMKKYAYKSGESYGIPYRCLIPKNLKNVYVAGRCVSTDKKVQSSIRVMPGCFITGQAAGMAASIAIENQVDTINVNIKELQSRLINMGAYIPNRV